jgi:hypothetical protein
MQVVGYQVTFQGGLPFTGGAEQRGNLQREVHTKGEGTC